VFSPSRSYQQQAAAISASPIAFALTTLPADLRSTVEGPCLSSVVGRVRRDARPATYIVATFVAGASR
jgi:hypothetical protein